MLMGNSSISLHCDPAGTQLEAVIFKIDSYFKYKMLIMWTKTAYKM